MQHLSAVPHLGYPCRYQAFSLEDSKRIRCTSTIKRKHPISKLRSSKGGGWQPVKWIQLSNGNIKRMIKLLLRRMRKEVRWEMERIWFAAKFPVF